VPVQENAYYNLGDTQYRTGQAIEQSNPQDTIKIWERAVQSYSAALQIKPDDADARFNRDLVARKLEQLKKQMQQQEKQNQSSQGQSKQGQNRQNQKQTGQNDQQQNQQNQQPAGADQGKQPQQLQPAPAQSGQPQSPKPESRKGNGSQNPPPQIGQSAPDQPGEMSKDEANQLLDSLKSSEHKLPTAQVARGQVQPPDNQPYKDW